VNIMQLSPLASMQSAWLEDCHYFDAQFKIIHWMAQWTQPSEQRSILAGKESKTRRQKQST
jgi:hypothetical protein